MELPLSRVVFENFGCLKKVAVDLDPFTVFVGPNDSGKTMLLRGLELLSAVPGVRDSSTIPSPPGGWRRSTFQGRGGDIGVQVVGVMAGTQFDYGVRIADDSTWGPREENLKTAAFVYGAEEYRQASDVWLRVPADAEQIAFTRNGSILNPGVLGKLGQGPQYGSGLIPFKPFLEDLAGLFRALRRVQLAPHSLRQDFPRTRDESHITFDPPVRAHEFDQLGRGLPSLVADMLLTDRDRIEQIERLLASWFPHVRRVNVSRNESGEHSLLIETQDGTRVPASQASDGVVLVLGYLVLALGRIPRPVLLIEEPETGIHPGLLEKLVSFLRDLSTGEAFKGQPAAPRPAPVQIIMTTHSPLLLNHVEPRNIRVVTRDKEQGTSVTPFEQAPDLAKLLEYQGPGEIWANLGEGFITGAP